MNPLGNEYEALDALELDWPALERGIASAMGLIYQREPVESVHHTDRIGYFAPLVGYRFPVYLTIQSHPIHFDRVVDRLVATVESPFLLLTPTRRFFKTIHEDLLRRRQACFLPLVDYIGMSPEGELVMNDAGRLVLDSFRDRVVSGQQT